MLPRPGHHTQERRPHRPALGAESAFELAHHVHQLQRCSAQGQREKKLTMLIIRLTGGQMSQKCRQILAMDAEKLSAGLQLWLLYDDLVEYVL